MVKANYWYRKAAEQGCADAQCDMGQCYVYGWGVEMDGMQAVEWFHRAAEQGDAQAWDILNKLLEG